MAEIPDQMIIDDKQTKQIILETNSFNIYVILIIFNFILCKLNNPL